MQDKKPLEKYYQLGDHQIGICGHLERIKQLNYNKRKVTSGIYQKQKNSTKSKY